MCEEAKGDSKCTRRSQCDLIAAKLQKLAKSVSKQLGWFAQSSNKPSFKQGYSTI
jgi:hypothetical protein